MHFIWHVQAVFNQQRCGLVRDFQSNSWYLSLGARQGLDALQTCATYVEQHLEVAV
ncbi:hypothetical protein D3C76_1608290 [compost metagenome]